MLRTRPPRHPLPPSVPPAESSTHSDASRFTLALTSGLSPSMTTPSGRTSDTAYAGRRARARARRHGGPLPPPLPPLRRQLGIRFPLLPAASLIDCHGRRTGPLTSAADVIVSDVIVSDVIVSDVTWSGRIGGYSQRS